MANYDNDSNPFFGTRHIIIRAVSALVFIAVLALGAGVIGKMLVSQETPVETRGDLSERFADTRTVVYRGKTYVAKSRLTNILFMGIDKRLGSSDTSETFRNGGQADYLLLLVIDEENKVVTPVQIDRDTMTEITVLGVLGNTAGTRNAQISLSHGFGDGKEESCKYTLDAVSLLFQGETIHYFVAMNMDGIAALNDAMGGIEVLPEEDFTQGGYAFSKGQAVKLQGKAAEVFVRARMGVGSGTNQERMARQRLYMAGLSAAFQKSVSDNAEFAGQLFDNLKEYVITDMSRGRIINETWNTRYYTHLETVTMPGKHSVSQDGFMEFYPDEAALEALVLDLFYEPQTDTGV